MDHLTKAEKNTEMVDTIVGDCCSLKKWVETAYQNECLSITEIASFIETVKNIESEMIDHRLNEYWYRAMPIIFRLN